MCDIGLVLRTSDQFKGPMATTSALGRWSLEARAQRLLDCHLQHQVGSSKSNDKGTSTARSSGNSCRLVV
jgi:hypothetical protein